MNILFSANISEKHQLKLREHFPDMTFTFCRQMDEARQHIDQATILVTYGNDLTADLVSQAASLKWIMVLSAGMEEMPFAAIREQGILVTNVRGIHKYPMAEYALSMLLQVYRQEKQLMKNEEEKVWDPSLKMHELNGDTLLIAGTGAIGQEVARLAKAFRMTVYGVSRSGRKLDNFDSCLTWDELNRVLPEADAVVSVLPSTPETQDFFVEEHFQQLPDHAVFLNMGRGDVVQDSTILQAVHNETIAHAVLDVFNEEPLPADHPFWDEPNITITPHISGVSGNYLSRGLAIFEQNLTIYLDGGSRFENQIDLSRGY
ncbi:glycerate dehydrogenase [Barrientosiimonas marina]|uniref:D-2-hydroxyacid dehydrogenase n=1 Tax=Lentibacillus kimchii TaxID=1542911 RepID=A0ABW2UTP9_9BACI